METDHVPHAYPKGRYEDQPRADTLLHKRSIKVHCLVLLIDHRWWYWDLDPFHDEISQHLGVDGCPRGICNALTHQLERPFHGSPCGVLVLDDLTEGEGRHDRHRV